VASLTASATCSHAASLVASLPPLRLQPAERGPRFRQALRAREAREERQAARDRETLLWRMVEQMQQRYNRLLDMPRPTPPPAPSPAPRAGPQRRRAAPQASGPACDATQHVLGRLCPRGHDFQNPGKSVRRLPGHVCVACDAEHPRERRKAKRAGTSQGDGAGCVTTASGTRAV
jgi:hypothetical protein